MKNIDKQFNSNLEKAEAQLELLNNLFAVERDKLPENVSDPERAFDSTQVSYFANKVYALGCEIADLGEKMMVGKEVEKSWNEKNCYESHSEKMADLGHKAGDF